LLRLGAGGLVEPGAGMVRFRAGRGHGAARSGWVAGPGSLLALRSASGLGLLRVREACPDSVQPGW